MEPSRDPVMLWAGWEEGAGVRGLEQMLRTAPLVALGLFVAVNVMRMLVDVLVGEKGLKLKDGPGIPAKNDVSRQMAFCLVGVGVHLYLGPTALISALSSGHLTYEEGVGNREALMASPAARDVTNAQAILGELFTGYALYITVMWLLGWEKGRDKLIHHLVFLFLGALLSGTYSFPQLSAFAMSMELSTVFLNVNIMTGWFHGKAPKAVHLVTGALFIVAFISTRIVLFGYAMWGALSGFSVKSSAVPLPLPIACLVLFLYSGGWLLQVYWLTPIYHKLKDMFGPKPKVH